MATTSGSASSPRETLTEVSDPDQSPVAERRICSVLFVDLVGFTPLAEKRDPEHIRELLSLYFARAQTIIGHYGGTVEKFIGDAVMAVWGAPVANEDDAERAVRAGLEMVAAVAEIGQASGISDLQARGGIVTGEVAITIGKVAEGMVLGDTVNSASRVQSVAQPGTVLVDESTWRAASEAIAFAEVGELTLKGRTEQIRAWQALRVVAQRKGIGRTEGLEPPFVGRDGELRLVKDLLHATIQERRVRLVSVTGVPGIGKSRLAWEFLKYVDGLADTVYWHQGRSPAYGEGITFWALGEMVRTRARINESEDAADARAKLAATVSEFVGDPEERRWVEPRLAHLLGLANALPGDREELFSAWRTFFERVADSGPTVMIFEDLQWADPGLIDFVESMLEWSRNHPIFVVTLARPELVDRRPTWGAGQRSFFSMHLESLPEAAMRALLEGFVHGLPEAVVDEILERSEGVPLYAVEMVRTLVDNGVLSERDGAYDVTGDLTSFEVPETLQALIGSRLDALPPEQRSLLQDAAVLGTTFSASSLAALQGVDASKLEADLRDLVRKEFVSLDSNPLSPERGQYGFVQSLIQEVARSRLARRDRSAKHLAVARYFESLDDQELAAAVAAHYVEAFRAAPEGTEAGVVAESARDWLSRAGERALSLGSPEQAEAFFDQALEVTPGGAGRAALLERTARAAFGAAHDEQAVSLLQEAIPLYEAAGNSSAAGHATVSLFEALASLRRIAEGLELVERALASADELDDSTRAELAWALASGLSTSGRAEEALRQAETALTLAERTDSPALLARSIGIRAQALFHLGRHREAVVLARGMAKLAEEVGALREQSMALLSLSVYLLDDDPVGSMSIGMQSADLARRGGHRGGELTNLLNTAETSVYIGKWDDTRTALAGLAERELNKEQQSWLDAIEGVFSALTGNPDRGLSLIAEHAQEFEAMEFLAGRTTRLVARATVKLTAGDLLGAKQDASEAVETDPNGINTPLALAVAAHASLWLRDADGARTALEAMRGFRGRWMAAVRLTTEAGLAALQGDPDGAKDTYRAAFGAWTALDCVLDLALAQLDSIVLLGADLMGASVVEDLRGRLSELGAVTLLERLERSLGETP